MRALSNKVHNRPMCTGFQAARRDPLPGLTSLHYTREKSEIKIVRDGPDRAEREPRIRRVSLHRKICKDSGPTEKRKQKAVRPHALPSLRSESSQPGYERCASCRIAICTEELVKAARSGRVAAHSPEAEVKRREGRRRHAAAIGTWNPIDQPEWLTEEVWKGIPLRALSPLIARRKKCKIKIVWYLARENPGLRIRRVSESGTLSVLSVSSASSNL